jgi:hypothetical protein
MRRHKPAAFAIWRLEIDVLRVSKYFGRGRAEQNDGPRMHSPSEVNKPPFGVDMAYSVFQEQRGL